MTDNTVPNSLPDPMDDTSSVEHNSLTPEVPNPSETLPESDWYSVEFPGQVPLADEDSSDELTADSKPSVESTILPPSNSNAAPPNTDELIQLIQDLNHCNDALLNRISSLEDSLEQSQSALQIEIERNQVASSQGASAAPRQVAQLLGELDIANDGLRRTTMHNEALQAELDVNQQRVAQLERECTLLQQRFNEKSVALQQAEHTCRDLKSRLHRQQRYTLQFKAALEKCLNMTTQPNTSGGVTQQVLFTDTDSHSQPIAIPKSQHIQPWSAEDSGLQNEMGLDDLLRGFKTPQSRHPIDASVVPSPPAQSAVSPTLPPSDPEAETVLWQDLERVTEPPAEATTPTAAGMEPQELDHNQPVAAPPSLPLGESTPEELTFTEPSPWGAPLPTPAPDTTATSPESLTTDQSMAAPQPEEQDNAFPIPSQAAAPAPSPPSVPPAAPTSFAPSSQEAALPGYLQGTGQRTTAAPSPVVYPLRSQKKRKSLASVELPNFGRSAHRR
jgi:hypothetical protein